ncbi:MULTISPECIES: FEKKY domain-containing protein [Aquimarina]|uniref:FEKKY domain-containing protein n=1 Tax=Aquimarina TaxID=290174 RepID=UPI000944858C|nr:MULTISPECIES: hypothetical protein [Aquimarina]
MNRKKIITIVILLLGIGITLSYFGFFNRFNYITAKLDITNNNPQKVLVGLPFISPTEMNKVSKKYGFKNIRFGCIISGMELNGIDMYNDQMDQYLTKINGVGWELKYNKEIDSLIKMK